MTEYKYELLVYQILDDGDLKFLFFYNAYYVPQINGTICVMCKDDEGKPNRRIYFEVKDILYCTDLGDKNSINDISKENIVLHVKLLVDEPVL